MEEWYESLAKVKKAFDDGRLKGARMHLWKNYSELRKENGECVFVGNEHQGTLAEVLDLLGIPYEFE